MQIDNYRIIKRIGTGGSSMVHIAEKQIRGKLKVNVLVKELLTKSLEDKITYVAGKGYTIDNAPLISNDIFKEYLNSFEKEQQMHVYLRANGNPYVFDLQDIIEANNTYYTITSYESGCMLIDKKFHNLHEIISCMISICDCLHSIHEKGVLYLDISPNNIHISDLKIDGKNVARLIDFNNSIEIGKDIQSDTLFINNSFSPVELLALSEALNSNYTLGFFSDTFSLCGVFYYMLTKKSPFEYSFNEEIESEYFQNQPEIVKRLCLNILKKGLDDCCNNRYQSTDEIIKDLSPLLSVSDETTPYIVHNFCKPDRILPNNDFIWMNVDRSLRIERFINIYGKKISLKNTFVQQYCAANEQNYDCIQELDFVLDTENTFLNLKTARINERGINDIYSLLEGSKFKTLIVIKNCDTYLHSDLLAKFFDDETFFETCESKTNAFIKDEFLKTIGRFLNNPMLHFIFTSEKAVHENNLPFHQFDFTLQEVPIENKRLFFKSPDNTDLYVRFYMYAHNFIAAHLLKRTNDYEDMGRFFMTCFDDDVLSVKALDFVCKVENCLDDII